jgi:Na+-driven multidrug efflux pump
VRNELIRRMKHEYFRKLFRTILNSFISIICFRLFLFLKIIDLYDESYFAQYSGTRNYVRVSFLHFFSLSVAAQG